MDDTSWLGVLLIGGLIPVLGLLMCLCPSMFVDLSRSGFSFAKGTRGRRWMEAMYQIGGILLLIGWAVVGLIYIVRYLTG